MLKKSDKSVNSRVVVVMVEFFDFFWPKNDEKNVIKLANSRGVVVMVAFFSFLIYEKMMKKVIKVGWW